MTKPILCIDWDGVIHPYTKGWLGASTIDPEPPVPGALGFLLEALNHFDVVIYSSRSGQRGGVEAMQRYLRELATPLNAWHDTPSQPGLESIRFEYEKPPTFLAIDDRALTFTGTWPTIQSLKEFKPWNKK